MVKNTPSELNLLRQRRRSAIQLYIREHPDEKMNNIAKIFKVSPVTVAKWKKRDSFIDLKRKTKMTKKIKNFLLSKAKNKFTGIDNASSRKLAIQIEKRFKIKISFVTVNNWLRSLLKKPIKARKTFLLRERDKKKELNLKK